MIACDGASSGTRQQLGIAFEDLVFDEPWLVVDLQVNNAALGKLPETAAQFCDPSRPTSFIIGPGNHRRFEIMLLPGEDPREMEEPAQVWRLLARWITPDDATLWRAASYRFHALVAQEWRRGRVFLAGDAAHQQPPFIGQGMCQGIRDVGNLVWKLDRVLKGQSGAELLDTYGEERSEHVRQLTTRIKAIGHVICERDPVAAEARDARILSRRRRSSPHRHAPGDCPAASERSAGVPAPSGARHAVSAALDQNCSRAAPARHRHRNRVAACAGRAKRAGSDR